MTEDDQPRPDGTDAPTEPDESPKPRSRPKIVGPRGDGLWGSSPDADEESDESERPVGEPADGPWPGWPVARDPATLRESESRERPPRVDETSEKPSPKRPTSDEVPPETSDASPAEPQPRDAGEPSSDRPARTSPEDGSEPSAAPPRPGERLIEVDEVEIQIDQLVAGGEGLGRWQGIPIFVPRSAPGDRLRVRVVERKPDWGRAEIVEILEPGAGRREPPCPYFARCGGCDLQHLEDARQVELKVLAFGDTLRRIGKLEAPPSTRVVAGEAWGYRLRARLRTAWTERGATVGYFARGSQELVPVDRCPILVPELDRFLSRLPRVLDEKAPNRLDVAAGDEAWTTAPVVEGLPHGEVSIRVGEDRLSFDARSFFQAHRGLLEELSRSAVGDERGERAVDLYGGVGLFTLPLARRYGEVVSVESDRIATRFAKANLRRAGLRNTRVETRSAEDWVRTMPAGLDRVVVDPPRKGLHGRVRRALLENPPRRLTYVSCDAATLARDLRHLTSGFRIDELTLIDLFPQTGHLEAVVQLTARGSDDPGADGEETASR